MGDVFPILPARGGRYPPSSDDDCQVLQLHDHIAFSEFENEYVLTLELIALGLVNIDINLVRSRLHIAVDWQPAIRVSSPGHARSRNRVSRSSLHRSFGLPADVMRKDVSATYGNGVLKIRLPREGDSQEPRKIEIANIN